MRDTHTETQKDRERFNAQLETEKGRERFKGGGGGGGQKDALIIQSERLERRRFIVQ